ncbi:SusD/RagB family nutrient-binding outer membrane lipoprotein [Mucilaginibacter achroorhodeus]|uniref:SusD/RagB family nutrient-binding outer membrane lipoprotein n=1 Tax=Mucilaginibacter achroorhodeus TaxID=2599294 RepID=A0A563U7D3_9SPHI|nr:SusD/RagB family nutrient-binding outer membrane lipoprotein [Mucilaginibacter achroorhodeus]TWR27256.1 SusD/RagB family nutrient-binding outer membrane lipoprotein [Mucilaginibacter achroorhodeus]
MKYKYIILITCVFTALTGCKKYIDVNKDPNRPVDVKESLMLAPVEAAISQNIVAGGNLPIVMQEYMQVIALNQVPPNLDTYLMYHQDMDGDWYNYYVQVMNNLVLLNKKAEANGSNNYAGISKILLAYSLGSATDAWGDVPFSNAFKGIDGLNVTYDSQESIYNQIQTLLDNAIADIGKGSTVVPAGDDYYFNGDMTKWKKVAYTLKARYYMHLTKAPGRTAAAQAQLALAALANGMASNDDDMKMPFSGAAGAENPWQQNFLPASTLVLASTVVDGFKTRNDPRLTKMVAPAIETGLYNGRVIGTDGIGSLQSYSLGGAFYASTSSNNYILNYSEALFLKAEATLIVSGVTAAQPVYLAAVQSHMSKLGIATTDVANYLASRGTLTTANALRLIIEEKNVANFLSMENYTDWRRTGYPALTKVKNGLSDIPRRVLYPQSEITVNPQPQQSAKLTDRVWWDAQ